MTTEDRTTWLRSLRPRDEVAVESRHGVHICRVDNVTPGGRVRIRTSATPASTSESAMSPSPHRVASLHERQDLELVGSAWPARHASL